MKEGGDKWRGALYAHRRLYSCGLCTYCMPMLYEMTIHFLEFLTAQQMTTTTYLSFSVKFSSLIMSIIMGSFRASLLFELQLTPIVVKAYKSKVNYKW